MTMKPRCAGIERCWCVCLGLGLSAMSGCSMVRSEAGAAAGPSPHGQTEHPLVWTASYSRMAPVVDGRTESAWSAAQPLIVIVREALGGTSPLPVTLRALYTDDSLYVLAEWPDPTRDDMRDPYFWDAAAGKYQRPIKPDDQFALEFELSGEFDVNMLAAGKSFVADVWHWKAGRGNPIGYVDDKRHVISSQPSEGAKRYDLGGHASVYIARLMDEGTPSWKPRPAPSSHTQETFDSFEHQEPSGSVADVKGKGVHNGRKWTLEMARKLDTVHPDDTPLDPAKAYRCAIAVLDNELYWNHSVSSVIQLRFAPR